MGTRTPRPKWMNAVGQHNGLIIPGCLQPSCCLITLAGVALPPGTPPSIPLVTLPYHPFVILSLHHPLIISLHWLVVASPLVTPPSCPLVTPPSPPFAILSLSRPLSRQLVVVWRPDNKVFTSTPN